ncbi:50S ribosomal protein L11 methyltransferase [Thermaurantiacus sp.]
MPTWVLSLDASRAEAEAALAAEEPFPGLATAALSAVEGAAGWQLLLHLEAPPDAGILARFRALVPSADGAPSVCELPETDWVRNASEGLAPVDAGRFHLHMRATAGRARPGQIALRIEAGQAFGTGHHASTRGVLMVLDRLRRRGRLGRVLDLGTGSGVLGIAAARADRAARVVASDIDPVAVHTARANARANRARHIRFACARGLLAPPIWRAGPYDLVLANILAGPLVALATGLRAAVRPGGRLALAGLLTGQTPAVVAAYRARGLVLAARTGGEWPVLILRRRGGRAADARHGLPRAARAALVRAARRGTGAAPRGAGTA